jgi:UDP-N-acetylglucosamine diphosphorylase/glucosamine-1-phosphate N-acetyltransferase
MHVVLFEGQFWTHMAPLSLSRPVFLMATGTGTLLDKQIRYLKPERLSLWVRPELAEYTRKRVVPKLGVPTDVNVPLDDKPALLMSARTLHFSTFAQPSDPCASIDDGDIVRSAFAISPGLSPDDAMSRSPKWLKLLELPRVDAQSRLTNYAWDLLSWNEESIVNDFIAWTGDKTELKAGPYHVIEPDKIRLGRDVKIAPGAVLDASKGPIMLGDGASVGANAVVQGPCAIGPAAVVAELARVRPGTSVGPVCKVGGEVSSSILTAHSNKSHDGYLGDSYVGQWVNLGAGTTTSNLKNTYDEVSIPLLGEKRPSGRKFLGSVIGDHAKTAIGTRLMTGSYIGYSTMIASSKITPQYVPSYTFLTDRATEPYRRDKALEVMRAVMARRGLTFDATDEHLADYASSAAKKIEKQ